MKYTVHIAIISISIWLAGCNKSGPSIVGTWTQISYKTVVDSDNVQILDTTYTHISGHDTFAFYANGRCALARYTSPLNSTYQLVGNTIVIPDSVGQFAFPIIDTIAFLSDHSLVLLQKASTELAINGNNPSDTTRYTHHYIYSYSR